MPRTPAPSLEAWPGEAARPPLRLLDAPHAPPAREPARTAPAPATGWLRRLRMLLRGAA